MKNLVIDNMLSGRFTAVEISKFLIYAGIKKTEVLLIDSKDRKCLERMTIRDCLDRDILEEKIEKEGMYDVVYEIGFDSDDRGKKTAVIKTKIYFL